MKTIICSNVLRKNFHFVIFCFAFLYSTQVCSQISNSDPCGGGINQIFNIGYGRNAICSEIMGNANNANDGNNETVFSISGESPFWYVDFDTLMLIHGIDLIDNNSQGLTFNLTVWNFDEDSIIINLTNNNSFMFSNPISGSKLSLGIEGLGVLDFSEIIIIGQRIEKCNNGIDDDCDGDIDCEDYDCGPSIIYVNILEEPSCKICADGKIEVHVINKKLDQLRLSVDGGQNYITPNGPTYIFENLGEGDYDVLAKDINTNCEVYWSENSVSLRAPEGNETELCENGGFEAGDFTGWEGRIGNTDDNVHSLPNISFGNPDYNFKILSNHTDPYAPIILPFSGTYTLRMGGTVAGAVVESIEKCFVVTSALSDFNFNYALVLQDPDHDPLSENPKFAYYFYKVESDGSKTLLSDLSFEIIADASNEYFKSVIHGNNQYAYKGWTCVTTDLSNYIDQELCVKFVNSDCKPGVHWGYCYIDGVCGDGMQNNPVLSAGVTSTTVCMNQDIIIDILEAKGFNKYSIAVEKYSTNNQLIDAIYYESIDYVLPNKLNLVDLFQDSPSFFECNYDYHVTIVLYNDCTDPVEQEIIISYICEQYDINYKDIIVCGQPNVNVTMQGTNGCGGCPIDWQPSYLLSDNSLHFPTILGSYYYNAFSQKYNYETTSQEGCVYSGVVSSYFLPKPIISTFSSITNHCKYNIMVRVSYDFLGNNNIGVENLILEVLGNGVAISMQYNGVDQESNEHIYTSVDDFSNLITATIIAKVFWDFNLFSSDYIVLNDANCTSSNSFVFDADDSFHGDFNIVMPNAFNPQGVNNKFAPVVPYPLNQTEHNSTEARLVIFDRWGVKVYDKTVEFLPSEQPFNINTSLSWDGTYNGVQQPQEVYAYVLYLFNCDNDEEIRGDVTLL